MQKFSFDIQRFDDLTTVSFGGGTASISSGISVTNGRKYAIGSDNDDTLVSSNNVFYLTEAMISLGGGKDSIEIEIANGYAITASNVKISAGADNDTIKLFGNIAGINGIGSTSIHPVSIDGGDGDDYIDIGASATYEGTPAGILSSAVTVNSGDGDDQIKIGSESPQGLGIIGASNSITLINGNTDSAPVSIDGGAGNDSISIYGGAGGIMSSDAVTINSGTGNDVISIYGGNNYGIGNATVSIDGGNGADTISVSSIESLSGVSIVAGAGDSISVGSGGANYLFDSADAVTINGAIFTASTAGTSANLVSYAEGTSIGSAFNGTVALSGTNSLADIDGSIVSAVGSYQIVDGKLSSSSDISTDTTVPPVNTATATVAGGKRLDILFLIDNTKSMNNYISDVKSNVNSFAQSLQNSGLSCRYGLIEFGDINDSSIKTYEFTSDIENFVSNVGSIVTTSGGDRPESGLEAILNGALTMNFDEDAEKKFIVITDASFHNQGESGDGDSSAYLLTTDVANALKDSGVTMDVVGAEDFDLGHIEGYGHIADNCRSEWEPLANSTGGKFYLFGSFPSIFDAITTDIVNIVDLHLVPENQTGYFVAIQNSDTYMTPIFQTNGASENATTVGAVNEINVYVADSDTDRQQTIILTDGWNVTATTNDDRLLINGVSATVTGGDGADLVSLGSDTRTVSLMDLDIDEDKLSFGNYITPGTMRQSIEDNHLVLSADDLRVEIPAMAEMTDEFLEYNVSNAGNSATIRELIYGDGKATISFAHWSFTFTESSLENFGF